MNVFAAGLLASSLALSALVPQGRPAASERPADTLTVRPLSSSTADLQWTAPTGAARFDVLRDGRLLDSVPASGGTGYQDHLLWASTAYTYDVKVFDAGGAMLEDLAAGTTTPAQTGSFPRLYASTSFWNTPIATRPAVDPDSAAIVAASLGSYRSVATFNDSDAWGIPIAYANPSSTRYEVHCTLFDCSLPVSFRIPRYAQPDTQTDGHLVVIDPSQPGSTELDMWRGVYDPLADSWTDGSRYVNDAFGWGANCALGAHCGGAVAAGFSVAGGIVRPEEIAQGHIDHALVVGAPFTRSKVIACPGTNAWVTGGFDDPTAIPLGARIQLNPTFDVGAQSWPDWQKTIARALQTYGAYVADNAGSLEVRAEANLDRGYDAWAKVGIPSHWPGTPSLAALPWSKFR
ncbi:MAG TPA: hypothetical protein VGA30_09850, partial [Actinomycetota bacterium]